MHPVDAAIRQAVEEVLGICTGQAEAVVAAALDELVEIERERGAYRGPLNFHIVRERYRVYFTPTQTEILGYTGLQDTISDVEIGMDAADDYDPFPVIEQVIPEWLAAVWRAVGVPRERRPAYASWSEDLYETPGVKGPYYDLVRGRWEPFEVVFEKWQQAAPGGEEKREEKREEKGSG